MAANEKLIALLLLFLVYFNLARTQDLTLLCALATVAVTTAA